MDIYERNIMKYFKLEELVPKETFEQFGASAWMVFKPEALEMLDGVREFLATPLVINDWHIGGKFNFSGYRPHWCNVGAKGSAHREGMAFDCKSDKYTAEEMRQKILADIDNPMLKYINRIEADVGWLHVDLFEPPPGKKRIYVFHV
jgi:hypothetical protein